MSVLPSTLYFLQPIKKVSVITTEIFYWQVYHKGLKHKRKRRFIEKTRTKVCSLYCSVDLSPLAQTDIFFKLPSSITGNLHQRVSKPPVRHTGLSSTQFVSSALEQLKVQQPRPHFLATEGPHKFTSTLRSGLSFWQKRKWKRKLWKWNNKFFILFYYLT